MGDLAIEGPEDGFKEEDEGRGEEGESEAEVREKARRSLGLKRLVEGNKGSLHCPLAEETAGQIDEAKGDEESSRQGCGAKSPRHSEVAREAEET